MTRGVDTALTSPANTLTLSSNAVTASNSNIHKSVVCPQSEFFAKAVNDGRFKEGQTGVIELPPEDDPGGVQAMLDFFYFEEYEIPRFEGTSHRDTPDRPVGTPDSEVLDSRLHPMMLHISVYEIADRIQQLDLKTDAATQFQDEARFNWHHAEFPDAIRKVYEIAPSGRHGEKLREMVVNVAAEHAQAISKIESFKSMRRENYEFSADWGTALCEQLGPVDDAPKDTRAFAFTACQCSFTLESSSKVKTNLVSPMCRASCSSQARKKRKVN